MTFCRQSKPSRLVLLVFAISLFATLGLRPGSLHAAELNVMSSGGLTPAFKLLQPRFEQATGHTIKIVLGPSMGTTVNAIPARLRRGEPADVVIMVGYALDDLIAHGLAKDGSRVDIARSPIGIAVRKGAPKPDISSVEKLKAVLLAAHSVAYSDSASGVYIEREMFAKLGIAEDMKGKGRMIPATPVGEIVAHGEAEIGFQQVSELVSVEGIDFVGVLPDEVQKITMYSAGIASHSKNAEAAEALLRFLASAEAAPTIKKTGLDPIAQGN